MGHPVLFLAGIMLGILCLSPVCGAASESNCAIALRMMAPHKPGSVVRDGWRLTTARCLDSGVYEFSFERGHGRSLLAEVSLFPVENGKGGAQSRPEFSVFIKQAPGQAGPAPGGARGLLSEIHQRMAAWTARNRRMDSISLALVLSMFCAGPWWITRLAAGAQAGRRGAWINIQLSLAVLVLLLAGAELCFRIFSIVPREQGLARFMEDVKTQRILHGGYRRIMDREHTGPYAAESQLNELGFRGRTFARYKKPHTVRIACVGDSFMFGVGIGPDQTFPHYLDAQLRKTYPDQDFEVMNFGIPGGNMDDHTALLLTEVNTFNPDLVVMGYVLNDMDPPGYNNINRYYDGVGFDYKNLERMLARHDLGGLRRHLRIYHYFMSRHEDKELSQQVTRMYVNGYDPAVNKKGLARVDADMKAISEYYAARRTPVVLFIYPLLINLDATYPFARAHARIARTARSRGMKSVDTLPSFLGKDASSLWVSLTDHHPNSRGQRIAAAAVSDFMEKEKIIQQIHARAPAAESARIPAAHQDRILARVRTLLRSGNPRAALTALAPVLAANPEPAGVQTLRARVILDMKSCLVLRPVLFRLRNISHCPECADRILREARASGCAVNMN